MSKLSLPEIKEHIEDYFIYFIDDGYRAGCSHNDSYSITTFNLYKNSIELNNFDNFNWLNDLNSESHRVSSVQRRLLNLMKFDDQHVLSSIKFSVFTYYDYPNNKSTLEPGLIEYSSILNGEIIIRDISDKLLNLKMDKEDLEENGMIRKPIKYYYSIQIQSEIDWGNQKVEDVLKLRF